LNSPPPKSAHRQLTNLHFWWEWPERAMGPSSLPASRREIAIKVSPSAQTGIRNAASATPTSVCAFRRFLSYTVPMKGNAKVLTELNKALREELTAINQYFLHAEMCENWGYHRLSGYIKKQSIGEMKHAESLMERILFLDGTPSMQPLQLTVGASVKQMIDSDLALEVGAVKQYNQSVQIATQEGDNGSRDLFVQLLKDEEGHVDWLEAQVHQIKELGYERYLTQQMGENDEEGS
jgi:bacterioferritin